MTEPVIKHINPKEEKGEGFGIAEVISFIHWSGADKQIYDNIQPILEKLGLNPQLTHDVSKMKERVLTLEQQNRLADLQSIMSRLDKLEKQDFMADLQAMKTRLDKFESQEEREKQTQVGLDLLRKKYAIFMCERTSIPWCFSCFFN
jgi:hypothetical protein